MQSMFSHLLHEQKTGVRNFKKLNFVWIQRDPELMIQSEVATTSASLHGTRAVGTSKDYRDDTEESHCGVHLASRILANVPASSQTDVELEAVYLGTAIELSEIGWTSISSGDGGDDICGQRIDDGKDNGKDNGGDEVLSSWIDQDRARNVSDRGEDKIKEASTTEMTDADEEEDLAKPDPPGWFSLINSRRHVSVLPDVPENVQAVFADTSTERSDIESTRQPMTKTKTHNMRLKDDNIEEYDEEGSEGIDPEEVGNVVDVQIFLTKDVYDEANIPGLQVGRPNIAALFAKMREEAIALKEKRVAVCVCGPKPVSYLCRKACVQLSDSIVRFDYHEESFG